MRDLTLQISEQERGLILGGLLRGTTELNIGATIDLIYRIHMLAAPWPNSAQNSGAEAAKAVLSPPPLTVPPLVDRWARDRKGVEQPNPEGCETLEVEISKLERKEDPLRTRVTFPAIDGKGFAYANCFDEKLFPYLANRIKQRTRLYVVRSGKYLNVVGVKA